MTRNQLPLRNKNIILTTSKDNISEVAKLFKQKGSSIYELPALVIQYPDNLDPLDEALLEINNFHWVIFSSSNGIKFLDKRLRDKGTSLKQFSKKIKIAVVGEKTSKTLNDFGIDANYTPPEFIAESLIENFPISGYGLSIFLPRVQTGGRSLIAEEFRNSGARVIEVPAYESKCPDKIPEKTLKAIKEKIIDAIIFSSGKTVKNTAYLLEKHFGKNWLSLIDEVKLFSIGPQTSVVCKEIFGRVDKEASKYTFEGLLSVVIDNLA